MIVFPVDNQVLAETSGKYCCEQTQEKHENTSLVVSVRLEERDCRSTDFRVVPYRGADKFLARPGRKQANVSVKMA